MVVASLSLSLSLMLLLLPTTLNLGWMRSLRFRFRIRIRPSRTCLVKNLNRIADGGGKWLSSGVTYGGFEFNGPNLDDASFVCVSSALLFELKLTLFLESGVLPDSSNLPKCYLQVTSF